MGDHLPFGDEVSAVDDVEGFANIMVGDEDGEAGVAQIGNDLLDIGYGDGVDPAEGFVEHEEAGFGDEGAGDGEATFFSTGEGEGDLFGDVFDAELLEEFFATEAAFGAVEWLGFEDRHDIFLDGHFAKDGLFLGEVTHSHAGATIHGKAGNVFAVKDDAATVWLDQAHDHVEAGGFSGAVWAE